MQEPIIEHVSEPYVALSTRLVLAERQLVAATEQRDVALSEYRESIAPFLGTKAVASFDSDIRLGRPKGEIFRANYSPVLLARILEEYVQLQLLTEEGGIYLVRYKNLWLHGSIKE